MDKAKLFNRVNDHYNEIKENYNVLGVFLQGSQNYGLDLYEDVYTSDVDTKSIILPSFDDFCKGLSPLSYTHIRANNEHTDLKDIRIMFETFKKQNVNFAEVLFTDFYVVNPDWKQEVDQLRSMGEIITHAHPKQTVRTMYGMSMEKRKALTHPYPSIIDKIEKWGYDGKQLHHIIRVNIFLKHYLSGLSFKKCLNSFTDQEKQLMIDAKLNKFTLEEAIKMADDYLADTKYIADNFIKDDSLGELIDPQAYEDLEELKVEILKKWFKIQLR